MANTVKSKVDETIVKICDRIQKDLEKADFADANMVKALAELVSARNSTCTYGINS